MTYSAPRSLKAALLSFVFVAATVLAAGNFLTAQASNTFQIGARVVTIASAPVRATAPKGTILGTQPVGIGGTITAGPFNAESGVKWWQVNYDSGADGWSLQSLLSTSTPSAPTVSIVASSTSITSGQSSTLTWTSTSATSCTASGGTFTGTKAVSGTQSVSPTANTTYTLACSGAGGTATSSATVTVTYPTPTVSITASSTSVISGASSTLTWSSTDATSCTASNGWSGTKATTSSEVVSPTATTTYTLTCTGAGGSAAQSTTVIVSTPPPPAVPTVTLTASSTSIISGSSSTLTWSSTDATSCTASDGWSGTKATSSSESVSPVATTTYTLACSGAGGTATSSATVNVIVLPIPTVSITASSSSIISGASSTLTWSSTDATSCTASDGWSGSQATAGTQSVSPTATTTYTLTCTGAGGSANQSTTITVATATPPSSTCPNPVGSTPDVRLCTVTRFAGNPLISPSTPGSFNNITMPSVLKVPSWLPNPLGAYYMYFAGHNGSYIRLAYANSPTGPWTIYAPGTLKDTMVAPFSNTISSPDVFAMDASHKIRMYFSTDNYPGSTEQWSGVSESTDGINFTLASTQNIAKYYLRVWQWAGQYFGLAKGWSTAPAELGVSPDGIASFAPIQTLTANGSIRHMAVLLKGDVLMVFYSKIGDAPERILMSTMKLTGPATSWTLSAPVEVLRPTLAYEGANYPIVASIKGPATNVNELRDPYILEDNGHTYLYYGIAGESGIAVAEITYEMVGGTTPPVTPPASTKFTIGARVQTNANLNVRATASPTGTLLGTQALGTLGTVVGGPVASGGFNWWNINFDSGVDGWSAEDFVNTYTAPPPPSTPTVSLSSSPTSITSGQSSTLTWSSTNATSCTASNGWTGTKATSGTQSVSPTANTTYTLTCTGAGGSANQSTTIAVTAVTPPVTPPSGGGGGAPPTAGNLQLAFPTADGYGKYAQGGRGGAVYIVSNLNDSGAGSLRECAEAAGPRTCVFSVSGTIGVGAGIKIRNPYITIAGQTSPGGIQLKSSAGIESPIFVFTHDVIIRHIRVRSGGGAGSGNSLDAFTMTQPAHDVILDHMSLSWGGDETLNVFHTPNLTVQWSMVYETLLTHSKDVYVDGDSQTFSHNLIAHSNLRQPDSAGGHSDWINNVFYDGGEIMGEFYNRVEPGLSLNWVGNADILGPKSLRRDAYYSIDFSREEPIAFLPFSFYVKDNFDWHRLNSGLADNLVVDPLDRQFQSASPIRGLSVGQYTDGHQGALDTLAFAGATVPFRDASDVRMVNDVRSCSGGFITDPSEVGGWPAMNGGTAPTDTDKDGMPDNWELAHGLSPTNASDRNGDQDGDGYTNLEEYLDELAGDNANRIGTGTGSLPNYNCGYSMGGIGVTQPVINFTATTPSMSSPSQYFTVQPGTPITINWTSQLANNCKISGTYPGGNIGNIGLTTSGTYVHTPTESIHYFIKCIGNGGSSQDAIDVNIAGLPPYLADKSKSAPAMSLSVSPANIQPGQSATISWSSNGSDCVAANKWTNSFGPSGSQTVSPTQTTTYYMSCLNDSTDNVQKVTVTVGGASVPPPSNPAPTVSVSASPTSITSGQSSTLTWSSNNATSCSASGGWSGALGAAGSQTVSPTTNTTYTVTCSGAGGSANQSTNVTVSAATTPAPTVTISSSPTSVTSGQPSTLTWSSTNATSCSASGGWSGSQATGGAQSVSPTANTTYTLTCTGAGGTANQSATVSIAGTPPANPAPTVSISASPTSITSGQSSTLTWSSTNATSCTASGGAFTGTKAVSGTQSVNPTANTTYTLTCTGAGGTGNQSTAVTVTAAGGGGTPGPIAVGSRIVTTANTNVRASAPKGAVLGTQALGTHGTVVGGPTATDSGTWWQIDYDSGLDGWSVDTYLAASLVQGNGTSVAAITSPLKPGITSSVIKFIQRILNLDPDTQVAAVGAGAPGAETGYFGQLTVEAIKKFQIKYGIVSSGTPETTGFGVIGPKTLEKLKMFGTPQGI